MNLPQHSSPRPVDVEGNVVLREIVHILHPSRVAKRPPQRHGVVLCSSDDDVLATVNARFDRFQAFEVDENRSKGQVTLHTVYDEALERR